LIEAVDREFVTGLKRVGLAGGAAHDLSPQVRLRESPRRQP
jgi:hypothetical protein